jgi:hypothetical protein
MKGDGSCVTIHGTSPFIVKRVRGNGKVLPPPTLPFVLGTLRLDLLRIDGKDYHIMSLK